MHEQGRSGCCYRFSTGDVEKSPTGAQVLHRLANDNFLVIAGVGRASYDRAMPADRAQPASHPAHPQLALDAQLCFPLYAATRALTRHYAVLLDEVGLTYPQYLTLLVLWGEEGAVSVGELGGRLRLDSGTLTPLLKRLESMGHVVRRRDPADERRVLIEATSSGWQLRERVAGVPAQVAVATGLSTAEGTQLRGLLEQLIAGMDQARGQV